MDFHAKKSYPNPRESASILSKVFFWWTLPIFKKGWEGQLKEVDDIYDQLKVDSAESLGDTLENTYERIRTKRTAAAKNDEKPSNVPLLLSSLISVHWKDYMLPGSLNLFNNTIMNFLKTMLLRLFIKSFIDPSITREEQIAYGILICIVDVTFSMTMHNAVFESLRMGMRCRIGITSLVYRKVLRLTPGGQRGTTVGQLSNFMSSDVNSVGYTLLLLQTFVAAPIQLLVYGYMLWEEFGIAALAGIGFILSLSSLQYFAVKYSARFRRVLSARTDERARVMNEIIHSMRVIKMYAWETPFTAVVDQLRKLEMAALKDRCYFRASFNGLYLLSCSLFLFLILLPYVLMGEILTADKVFFAAATGRIMADYVVMDLPYIVSAIGEMVVAMKRIDTMLNLDEHPRVEQSSEDKMANNKAAAPSVRMDNMSASWDEDKITLDNICLQYSDSKLVMVVGSVGSGKTSFLNAILGELPVRSGNCISKGRISYAAQEPWIFSGNIRQNITFGQPFQASRYEEILRACSLTRDLKEWPQGDMTLVGERGVLLSGGQKARIGLARALYREADIYLLDDPLSAVDVNVSKEIMEKCMLGFLQGKLRILVTHQLQYLAQADDIIVLHQGKILAQGKYSELQNQHVDFAKLIVQKESDKTSDKNKPGISLQKIGTETAEETKKIDSKEEPEQMLEGSVTWKTCWDYASSGGSLFHIVLLIIGFPLVQVFNSGSSYWLSHWTNEEKSIRDHNLKSSVDNINSTLIETLESMDQTVYLGVYSGLVLATCIGIFALAIHFFQYSMRVGVNMHNRMFTKVIRAPISFFDRQPSGRIINRFTKDLNTMDEFLPSCVYDTALILIQSLLLMMIVISKNLYMVFPSSVLLWALFKLRRYYIKTARSIKRIESTARSPIFTHLGSSFQGLTTIRASQCQKLLIKQFDGYQDNHTSPHFASLATVRWFGIWMELCCNVYLMLAVLGFLFLSTSILGGDVGLVITSIFFIGGNFQWGMRQSAEVENMMTSVERILEYGQLPSEEDETPVDDNANPQKLPPKKWSSNMFIVPASDSEKMPLEPNSDPRIPPENWPTAGNIRFASVSLSYNDTRVLDNLNFEIKSREKIGIVGRTGAGKSSIISVLLRMSEAEGNVFIDGIPIKDIRLQDLRKSISIIPQDPVLFSGTLRYNLDPFGQYEDSDLWKALSEVEMKEMIPALDFKVEERGSNFSVGQKQLVCLARAILRKNKIIVMDEATANVDLKTDSLIQKTIRTTFSDCTILTVAHRLDTVMDSDRIIVLDKGSVVKFGTPRDVLSNSNEIQSDELEEIMH